MTTVVTLPDASIAPLVLRAKPVLALTDDQFADFCALNRDWRIERTAEGDFKIMPPAFARGSLRNANLTRQLSTWAVNDGSGFAFDSSVGVKLSNNAILGPDASWVRKAHLIGLPKEKQGRFLLVCPEFVVELRSATDRLAPLKKKMEEYIENGVKLGWLIDPESESQAVYVYRSGKEVEELAGPLTVSAEPELPGFVLNLKDIWNPGF